MQILVVDDEASIAHLLTAYLTRNGHEVKTASNGLEALALLNEPGAAYDLAVIDFSLPDITGLEVAIESLTKNSARVILASGYELDTTLIPEALRSRVRTLRKPFMPKAILESF